MRAVKETLHWLVQTRVWRSVFRHGYVQTRRNQALQTVSNLFLHIQSVKVKQSTFHFKKTFYLGFIAFVLFCILCVTGFLLMFYYHPSVPQAYEDMKDLEHAISMGVFIRNMHRWGAHAMVIIVFLHLLRVFYQGAYRPPREFNWVIGVILFVLTLLLSYTGYLLPWDQLAFWGISVGTNMIQAAPWLGPKIRFLLLGGHLVSENALLRFYVLHCILLPLFLFMLVAVHVWRVRKDGGLSDKEQVEQEPAKEKMS